MRKIKCWNWTLCTLISDCYVISIYAPKILKKMGKALKNFKKIFKILGLKRKIFNTYRLKNELDIGCMVHFWTDRGGGWPKSSELQTFGKDSLQMLVYWTINFCHIFHKKIAPHSNCWVLYEKPKWKQKWYSFTAPSFRFHIPGFNIFSLR